MSSLLLLIGAAGAGVAMLVAWALFLHRHYTRRLAEMEREWTVRRRQQLASLEQYYRGIES